MTRPNRITIAPAGIILEYMKVNHIISIVYEKCLPIAAGEFFIISFASL